MYLTLVTVHVLAAITWLGGIAFLALVGAPALRRVEPPALRRALFEAIGMRFRAVGWGAVAILLITGVWLLQLHGWLSPGILRAPAFWRSGVGVALAWKLALVVIMIALSAIHDVASTATPRGVGERPDAGATTPPRWTLLLARVAAVAGVGVVVAAVRLVRS